MTHLCGRPIDESLRCVLGRETSIQKIRWVDDWPYVVDVNGELCNTPQDYIEIDEDIEKITVTEKEWKFNNWDFKTNFQSLRIPMEEFATIDENKGFLRLYGRESIASSTQAIVTTRQENFSLRQRRSYTVN